MVRVRRKLGELQDARHVAGPEGGRGPSDPRYSEYAKIGDFTTLRPPQSCVDPMSPVNEGGRRSEQVVGSFQLAPCRSAT